MVQTDINIISLLAKLLEKWHRITLLHPMCLIEMKTKSSLVKLEFWRYEVTIFDERYVDIYMNIYKAKVISALQHKSNFNFDLFWK